MNKLLLFFCVAAAASLTAAPQRMQLEWNCSYPANTAYEVEIDRAKLEKLAGIPQSDSCTVIAKVNGKEQKLATEVYPGKKQNSIALRFTVPAGTTELICETSDRKAELKDAAVCNNIFAGALDAKNIKKWKLSQGISISPIKNGVRLDAQLFNKMVFATYTVDVPKEAAGRPAKLELDVKSVSKMAWPNYIRVEQIGADGKQLPEYVTDNRWITQMRPSNILTQYRESGLIRPDTKKLRIYFGLRAYGVAYNNHGLPLKNKDDVTPHLEISRIVLRTAETLPFPKYHDAFFAPGVTGKAHDTAVYLKEDRSLFFSPRSMAAWGGQGSEIRNEKEFYFPTGDGTVELFIKPFWNAKSAKPHVLVNATSHMVLSGKYKGVAGRGDLFKLEYIPDYKRLTVLVQDANDTVHQISGKVDIPKDKWSHIAAQWSEKGGIQFYLNGKKVLDSLASKNPASPENTAKMLKIINNGNRDTRFSVGAEWNRKGITMYALNARGAVIKSKKISPKEIAAGTEQSLEAQIKVKSKTHKITAKWQKEGGLSFCVDGKVVMTSNDDITPIDIAKEKNPNDIHANQVTIGVDTQSARSKTAIPFRTQNFDGYIDVLRISTIARYKGDFTPQKTVSPDANTNALFNFDRTFDGTTLFGTGRIFNAVRSLHSKIERQLTVDGKTVDYFPKEVNPDADPRVVLNALNYPVLPGVKDFKSARKTERINFSAKAGDTRNIKLDSDVYMDFIEYANNTDKVAAYPFLIKKGEIDPRSFGDLADSLGIQGLTPKQKTDRIFQFLLASSDYFMNHQATFDYGSDLPANVEYRALMMLNGYCGFECGPLNNLSANLFTTAGLCPASQTAGYGHSFQSVFYDGKSHVYDLSAQKFFSAADNESAASLDELEQEPGLFFRYMAHNNPAFVTSSDHFVRLGNRDHGAQMPSYQEKVGMKLNPGEKLRIYYTNDGMVNDLQCAHHLKLDNVAESVDFEKQTGAKVTRPERKIFRIDRFFPHYANAFLVFNGKPEPKNPAFTVNKDSFCYNIRSCYPIVYGTYAAKLKDGSFADIEISTNSGKTFRALEKDADGTVREDYKVRARQGYILKIKAPIEKVANLTAVTEMQVNPRVLTCKLTKGSNELLFKSNSANKVDVTLQYRKAAKEIVIEGALYNGVIPGYERQTALLNPAEALELKVSGISAKAKVKSSSGVSAALKNGKLVITANDGKLPRFDFVEIDEDGAKKELTLIVARNAQLVTAGKATKLKKAKLVKANDNLIQDVVELADSGSSMRLNIAPVPAGNYTVWTLARFNSHLRPASGPRSLTLKQKGGWIEVAGAINCGSDFYKAQHGYPGERAQFKWDYPLKYRYPYQRPDVVKLKKTDRLDFKVVGTNIGVTEVAAVLIMPEQDREFLNQMIKVLCGYNHEPWKMSEANKELF